MAIEAVVFDFDGLILDTEGPEYRAWAQLWREAGVELSLEEWSVGIGTLPHHSGFHPLRELIKRSSVPLDEADLRVRARALIEDLISQTPVSPGVLQWAQEARALGLGLAIASTSSRRWIDGHLDRLGLSQWWPVVRCFDDCGTAKPDPASYLLACQALGVQARSALAVEDSRNGLLAAKAAGLSCVVVPSPMTAHMDFTEADLVLSSLADTPLAAALARLAPEGV